MSNTVTNELIYEILKDLQRRMGLIAEGQNDLKARVTSMDARLASVHTELAHVSDRMDRLENRIERVETRLNLNDIHH